MSDTLALMRLALAGMFLAAAFSKLLNRSEFSNTLAGFKVPVSWLRLTSILFPITEIVIGSSLLPASTSWWGSVAAAVLLVVVTIVVASNLAAGNRPQCNCFGQLHSRPIGKDTLIRNSAFCLAAIFLIWQGSSNVDPGVISTLYKVIVGQPTILVTLSLLLAVIGEAWIIFNLLGQQGRILLRLDELEVRLERAGVASLVQSPAVSRGLLPGTIAPSFELPLISGLTMSLDKLRELRRPILLIFSDPACGPCEALMPSVVHWQEECREKAVIAVVTRAQKTPAGGQSPRHALDLVFIQNGDEVSGRYRASATPSAVVINTRGLVAGPLAVGREQISALISALRAQG